MRKIFLFVMLMLLPAAAGAKTVTLDQAISIAMEKNRDIEKAREYAHLVQGKYIEERAATLPQLSLNGSTLVSKDDSQKIAGFPAQRLFGRAVDLTLSQQLYSWGKLSAGIRAAEVGLKTADEQLRLYWQAAYRDVVTAYYDIQLARELYRLAQENRSQKVRHLDEATRRRIRDKKQRHKMVCENALEKLASWLQGCAYGPGAEFCEKL